jgi:hypothetical protein
MWLGNRTSMICASGSSFSFQPCRLRLVLLLQRSEPGLEGVDLGSGDGPLQLERLQPEADLLLLVVDPADLPCLDPPDLAPDPGHVRQPALDLRPRLGARGNRTAAIPQLRDSPDQRAPFGPLDQRDIGGIRARGDLTLVYPAKIGAVDVPVAHLELHPILAGAPRHRLPLRDLAGQDRAVGQGRPQHAARPEEAEAVVEDQRHQPRHHQQGDRQRPSREPDERLATPPELAHR